MGCRDQIWVDGIKASILPAVLSILPDLSFWHLLILPICKGLSWGWGVILFCAGIEENWEQMSYSLVWILSPQVSDRNRQTSLPLSSDPLAWTVDRNFVQTGDIKRKRYILDGK